MRTTAILTALSLAVAAPAVAGPGADQLARSLGVAPGQYALPQLVLLDAAREEGGVSGARIANFVTASPRGTVVSSSNTVTGGISANEAQIIERATIRNATTGSDQILAGLRSDATTSDRGIATPAKVQIAAPLGLDAAAYTTAELVMLEARAYNAERN